MANPTKRWDRVPFYGWYFGPDDTPITGEVEHKIDRRVHMADGTGIYPKFMTVVGVIGSPDPSVANLIRQAMRDAYQAADTMPTVAGPFDGAAWDAWWTARLPAFMATSFYASDDPNISVDSAGYTVRVTEKLATGSGQAYDIQPLLAHLDTPVPGINLSVVYPPTDSPTVPAPPVYAKGIAGGIAALDAEGDVVDAAGEKVGAGLDEAALGSYLTTNQYATDADVTAATTGLVPETRTVAGKPLSANVSLVAGDVGAVPTTRTVAGKALSANVTLVPTDVGATTAGSSMVTAADTTAQRALLQLPDLNVKTFGALGNDGAADDTAAIQAAIDAAVFGQNVTFPRGIYRITTPLQMKLGTSLVGVAAARFAHYQTTTGANTSAPAIGSVIRVGSAFTGAAAVMATAAAAPGYTTGAVRIRDLVIDGRGHTTNVVDGFQATGVLYDARLERVTVLGMSGAGIKFQADGSGNRPLAAQLISVMVRGCAGHGFDLLFADSFMSDCYALSNGVTGSTSSGFVIRRLANTTISGCRSEWNGQQGFHFTGLSGGGGVVVGCVTDRNNWNGILCDGTGDAGNLLFSGIAMRRDGRNGASGGGGFAGFRTSGSTQAIVLTGFTITPGIDDDGTTGTLSPEVGIRASGTRSLSFSDGVAHAATTPIQDSGSNTYFGRGLNVTTATGTITSPTYSHAQDPTGIPLKSQVWRTVVKSGGTWPAWEAGWAGHIWVGADPDPLDMVAGDIRDIPAS